MKVKSVTLAISILSCLTGYSQKNDTILAKDYLNVANEMEAAGLENADVIDVLAASADAGNIEAAYIAGVYYLTGHNLAGSNKVKGLKYLENAAHAELVNAQALLTREYTYGEHLEENDEKARYWKKQLLNNKKLYTPTSLLLGKEYSALNKKIEKLFWKNIPTCEVFNFSRKIAAEY